MLSVICAIAGELGNLIRQPCSLPLCLHQSQKVETGIKMGGHRMWDCESRCLACYLMTFFLWIPINVQYFSVSYWCHNRSKQRNRCADRACNLQQAWSIWPDKSAERLHSYKGKCDVQLLESPLTSQSYADSDSASIVLQRYRVKKCSKCCDFQHLWGQRVVICHSFTDICTLYTFILVHLAMSWTDQTIYHLVACPVFVAVLCITFSSLHTYMNLTENLYNTNN